MKPSAAQTDYVLTPAEEGVLKTATQEAMEQAGERGGAIGGGSAGAAGGRSGGRFGVRLTKPRTAEATVELADDVEAVRERASAAIAAAGAVMDDPNAADDGSIWGIVPSGAMNMVPALVRIQVEAPNEGGSRVHVRATGREGLIKQKIGAKAAERLASALS